MNRGSGMCLGAFALLAAVLLAPAGEARGQTFPARRFEITPYGGYVWSGGYDVLLGSRSGELGTDAGTMWGIAAGYAVRDSLAQVEVLYNRQDTKMTAEIEGEKTAIDDVSVEYLQAGGLFGVEGGDAVWFTSLSLGATRLCLRPDEGGGSDEWRFSFIFGFGGKYYFNDRIGLRAQARLPYTFVEDSAKFYCGDAGCLNSAGGRGIWQFDLSLGLIIRL